MNWRQEKEKARRALHDVMSIEAIYEPPDASPIPTNVRLFKEGVSIGPSQGISLDISSNQIVFLFDDVPDPVVGGLVHFTDISYEISYVHPPDYPVIICDGVIKS